MDILNPQDEKHGAYSERKLGQLEEADVGWAEADTEKRYDSRDSRERHSEDRNRELLGRVV